MRTFALASALASALVFALAGPAVSAQPSAVDEEALYDDTAYLAHVAAAREAGLPVLFVCVGTLGGYYGATDVSTYWANTSGEPIRYLDVTFVPVNGVGDVVADEIDGHRAFTGRATGPFPPGDDLVSARWDAAWFNGAIERARITRVRVEYGTDRRTGSVTITDPARLAALVAPREACPHVEYKLDLIRAEAAGREYPWGDNWGN